MRMYASVTLKAALHGLIVSRRGTIAGAQRLCFRRMRLIRLIQRVNESSENPD